MGDPQSPSITLANLPWPVIKRILPMVPIQQLDELRLISPHWNTIILEYRQCAENYPLWKGADRVLPFHWDLKKIRGPESVRHILPIRTYSGFTAHDSVETALSYRTELIEDSSPANKKMVLWTTCIGPQLKLWDRLIATMIRRDVSLLFRNRRQIDALNGMSEAMAGVRIITLNFFGGALDARARSTMLAMIKSHQTLGVNIVTDFHNTKEARSFIASLMQLGLKKLEICDGWGARNPLYPDYYRKFWEQEAIHLQQANPQWTVGVNLTGQYPMAFRITQK